MNKEYNFLATVVTDKEKVGTLLSLLKKDKEVDFKNRDIVIRDEDTDEELFVGSELNVRKYYQNYTATETWIYSNVIDIYIKSNL